MRIKAVLGLLFLMALGAPAFGQSLVGKWTATAASPGGNSSETLTVVKAANGFAITGMPTTPPPEGVTVSAGLDIVMDGNHFSYKRTVTTPGGIFVITYSGVVSGDTFTGTADIGGTKVTYTGVRITGTG